MRRIIFHPGSAIIGVIEIDTQTKRINMGMFPNTRVVREGLHIDENMPPTVIDEGGIADNLDGNIQVFQQSQGYQHIQRDEITKTNIPVYKQAVDNSKKLVSKQDIKDVKKALRGAKNLDRLLGRDKK